jgi:hypothetical protein
MKRLERSMSLESSKSSLKLIKTQMSIGSLNLFKEKSLSMQERQLLLSIESGIMKTFLLLALAPIQSILKKLLYISAKYNAFASISK